MTGKETISRVRVEVETREERGRVLTTKKIGIRGLNSHKKKKNNNSNNFALSSRKRIEQTNVVVVVIE